MWPKENEYYEEDGIVLKSRLTLYGWFAFKIYAPLMFSLGLYDQAWNLLHDFKNEPRKYIRIQVVSVQIKEKENEKTN